MALVMPSMTAAVVQAAPDGQAGVASGVLNTARQVGGAIGVALLGSLVAGAGHLVSGMHLGLGVVAVVFALGALVAWRYTKQPRPAATRPDGGQDGTR
jgi:DHA2 family methylenomycin A resistance protein-like MFS transporter